MSRPRWKVKSVTGTILLISSNPHTPTVLFFPKALEDLKITFCCWRRNPRKEIHLGKNIHSSLFLLRRHIQHLKYIVLGVFLFCFDLICFALPFGNKDPWRKEKPIIGKIKDNWNYDKNTKSLGQIILPGLSFLLTSLIFFNLVH